MDRTRPTMTRRLGVGLLGAAMALVGVLALSVSRGASSAQAADLSQFNPGFIISDAIFYDSGTMNAPDIQSFLNQQGAPCVPNADGTPCLKDFHQATTSRAADTRCTQAYQGAADESAAQIRHPQRLPLRHQRPTRIEHRPRLPHRHRRVTAQRTEVCGPGGRSTDRRVRPRWSAGLRPHASRCTRPTPGASRYAGSSTTNQHEELRERGTPGPPSEDP